MGFYPETPGSSSSSASSPWQFNVASYGAKGNGKVVIDAAAGSGSTTLTSASAGFTAADVGKYFILNQGTGGSATNPLVGTITGYTNATTITLSTPTTSAASVAPFFYGTDDAVAINAAVTAAQTYALANNYKAQVLFSPSLYALGSGPYQTTAPNQFNAQVPVPVGAALGRKLVIDFIGVGDASAPDYWMSTFPGLQGSVLVSCQFVTSVSGTYGAQSVIGGPTSTTGLSGGGLNPYANTLINIQGVAICIPWNSGQIGYDFRYLAQANMPNGAALAFAPVNYSDATLGGPYLSPTNLVSNVLSCGAYFPVLGNNDNDNVTWYSCEGFSNGIVFFDHFTAARILCAYCTIGLYTGSGGGSLVSVHGASILYASVEACNYGLYSGGTGIVNIDMLDVEVINTDIISDSGNTLSGEVKVFQLNTATLTVNGGKYLKVTNLSLQHGLWPATGTNTQPAVPTSGTAVQNTAYRDALVMINGTVTGVSINGTAVTPTSLTNATVPVPSGQTITLTYGVAPTWQWVLY